MTTYQPQPPPPRFDTEGAAYNYAVLSKIENHLRVIKGWVIFFGVLAVLWLCLVVLAIGAASSEY